MKSAKEWAAEVVDGPEWGHAASSRTRRDVVLGDDEDYVMVYSASTQAQRGKHCEGCVAQEELIGIVERLVERVQADARAPLEEEIARLEDLVRGLRVDIDTWKAIARDGDDP